MANQGDRSRGGWVSNRGMGRARGGGGNAGHGGAGRGAGRGGAPFNAPAGPAADRDAGRGGYQHGRYGNNSSAPSVARTQVSTRPMGPPSQYMAPHGAYTDQTNMGPVGIAAKWTHCLRCRKPKDTSHPEFRNCEDNCAFCRSAGHLGEPCGMIYCSEKWWIEHFGNVPSNVQRRPSELQRQRLAPQDQYFANFPVPLDPQGPSQGLNQSQVHNLGTKRKAEGSV